MLKVKYCRNKTSLPRQACRCVTGLVATLLLLGLSSCNKNPSPSGPDLPPAGQIASTGSLPRWSPDGQKLAYGGSGSSAGIWVWDQPSGNAARIVDPTHPHNYDYRWSPGSDKLAFSGAGATIDSTSGLFTVNANGTELTRHHPTGKTPDWIPDGSGLVFAEEDFQSGTVGIFRFSFLDSSMTRLTNSGINPQVAPNGTKAIYLDLDAVTNYYKLKVVDIQSLAVITLRDTCVSFQLTLGGSEVVFYYQGTFVIGNQTYYEHRIRHISINGGGVVPIITAANQPSVSSQGLVVFVSLNSDVSTGIFAIGLDGSGFQQLTGPNVSQPCIKPDGSQVAFSNGNGIWVVNP
jgi:Tol biopolymer transport system component